MRPITSKVAAFFTCLVLSFCLQSAHAEEQLLILQNAQGETRLTLPIQAQTGFGIRFIHSVAKTPIEEWFRYQEGKLALFLTRYEDVGAGLPNEAPEGASLFYKDGYFAIVSTFTNKPLLLLDRLELRVGRIAEHTLLLPKNPPEEGQYREIPLSDYAKAGDVLVFLFQPKNGS